MTVRTPTQALFVCAFDEEKDFQHKPGYETLIREDISLAEFDAFQSNMINTASRLLEIDSKQVKQELTAIEQQRLGRIAAHKSARAAFAGGTSAVAAVSDHDFN